ncbi:MAG TPA: hypothetical protein EYN66_18970 [Myxococcales bacterium]|nr:hypothetical protein [Myxococcales bacterium]
MGRFLLAILTAFICLTFQPTEVRACSCVSQTPAVQVTGAEQVYLAKVVSETSLKTGYRTRFDLLYAVKGPQRAAFSWDRNEKTPLCGPSYRVGEFTMLFVKDNNLPLCAGNYGLSSQLSQFSKFLQSAGHKIGPLSRADMQAALENTLKGYLHKRPKITAYYGPLKGTSIQIKSTQLRFRKAGKWIRTPDKFPKRAVVVVDAARWRDIVSLNAVYLKEGVSARILLQHTKNGYKVLYRKVFES